MTNLTADAPTAPQTGGRIGNRRLALLLAIAGAILADYLIFQHSPGIGNFVFALFVAAAIAATSQPQCRNPRFLLLAGGALAGALPLIEEPGIFSLFSTMTGLALLALAGGGLLSARWVAWPIEALGLAVLGPVRLIADAIASLGAAKASANGTRLARLTLVALLPVAFFAVFLALFISANPLFDWAFEHASNAFSLDNIDIGRAIFWLLIIGAMWPVLVPKLPRWSRADEKSADATPSTKPSGPASLLLGHDAILTSLVLFNLLFAIQTLSDLAFLWGGLALPNGMTYAEYAHRGAYPLVATALLAAGFVLVAMRRNGPGENALPIRRLVYVFIGQNVLLVISSILRLDRYVEVYSLTGLRVASFIWMGLVATGLVLIFLRITWRRDNVWLVGINLWALGIVFYGSAWTDFSAMISRYNVTHCACTNSGEAPLDLSYLRELGPGAIPALDILIRTADPSLPALADAKTVRANLATRLEYSDPDWQAWNWRTARLNAWLDAQSDFPSRPATARNETAN